MNDCKKILIISAGDPVSSSSRMMLDMLNAMRSHGHQVTLLVKYPPFVHHDNVVSVYSRFEHFLHRTLWSIKRIVYKIIRLIKPASLHQVNTEYHYFGKEEVHAPVPLKRIHQAIRGRFDFFLVFFWQDFFASSFIHSLYEEYNVPLLLFSADMLPMTGGCAYFWNCTGYQKDCGKCPAIESDNKADLSNVIINQKRKLFSDINCSFLGNSWMIKHAIKSQVFTRTSVVYPVINENDFFPLDSKPLKSDLALVNKMILFAGSTDVNEKRKGFTYLVHSLSMLAQRHPEYLDKVVLLFAGHSDSDLQRHFEFQVVQVGYLPFERLPAFFSLADVFLCSSIQDAGPMMVNQSLMCGTPVVAFDIGVSSDLISKHTGYLARYTDVEDFYVGILGMLKRTEPEIEVMSRSCREVALKTSSYRAFEKNVMLAYERSVLSN